MSVLLMEDFRSYPTPEDMMSFTGRGGPWTTFNEGLLSSLSFVGNPSWRADGPASRALVNQINDDRYAPQRDFTATPVPAVCASFIVGTSGSTKNYTEACNFVLFQEPIVDKTVASSPYGLTIFYGVSIRATSSAPGELYKVGVYYNIVTSLGVTPGLNQVLLGYLRPWAKDRHYHVELKVDHSAPQARIIIYVNGVQEMDLTYDRDRIDNGFQTKTFKRVLLGGGSSSSSYRPPMYSNLVIYTDEAGTVFPMGPIDVATLSPTAGQGYDGLRAAPNADDSTYATVVPGGTLNGTFDDLASNPNPVLAVDATVRHGSVAGIEPSQITTRIRKSDGTQLAATTTTAAPGTPPTHRRVRLPAGTTAADVNGATFTINAAV